MMIPMSRYSGGGCAVSGGMSGKYLARVPRNLTQAPCRYLQARPIGPLGHRYFHPFVGVDTSRAPAAHPRIGAAGLYHVAMTEDDRWMHEALLLARQAEAAGEVPVGAVLLKDGALVGLGWNQPIGALDPTAHAEIMAMRAGAQKLGNYRLTCTTLYVTLEPCAMCAGALLNERVARLVYGASDPKTGAAGSVFDLVRTDKLNHRLEVMGGVLAEECGGLLKDFFAKRR